MQPRRSTRLAMKERIDYCELASKKSNNYHADKYIVRKKMRLDNGDELSKPITYELEQHMNSLHICEAPFMEPIPVVKIIKEKIIPSNDLMDKELAKQILTKLLNDFTDTSDMYGTIILIANVIYNCPSVLENNNSFIASIINLGVLVSDQFLNDKEVVNSPRVREIADAISILLSL